MMIVELEIFLICKLKTQGNEMERRLLEFAHVVCNTKPKQRKRKQEHRQYVNQMTRLHTSFGNTNKARAPRQSVGYSASKNNSWNYGEP
jgi:hypothetical protein